MTPTTEPLSIDRIFLEQAQSLIQGGEALPNGAEELAKRLHWAAENRTPLKVKLGLDPTRPDLHLGHTVVLRKLRAFQDLGHQAILIIGDATAMIGDPSGRSQTRPPHTDEEVKINSQTYLDKASKVNDLRKAQVVRNSEWLSGMQLPDFLKLAAKVTVAQILVRDDFSKRYGDNKPIYLHELFYPLMQGYDSVMIDADIELGGTDQRFNNLMGRELQLAYGKKVPQMVLLMPLLEGTDGIVKMSKSYPEHCINITDAPEDMYGKMMSIPDELIVRYERLLTPINHDQLAEQEQLMKKPADQGGLNPRDVKAHLAKWLVTQYYSQEEGEAAEQHFINLFKNKELPTEMPEIVLAPLVETHLPGLMVDYQLAPSKGEARRLIQGGGVRLIPIERHSLEKLGEGEKVQEPDFQLVGQPGSSWVLQVGKRKFLRIHF
ncbi:MAG: tyrosine--tRNA ligase [Cyanobacteria bacterium]|nr:tyrosine--tRNA ligase [Cyanobacteriota bacterium]